MFNSSLILENYSDFIAANQDLFQEATSAASIITDPLVYESYCDKLLEGIEESTARTIRGQFNRTREMLLEESSTLMASPEAITYAVASFPMLVDIYAEPLLSKVCSVYPSAVPTMTIPRLKWIAKVVSIKGVVTEYEFPNAQALIRVGIEKAVITGNFGNILAAFYAKNLGLPIAKLICASNENKVLFDFFSTGTYDRNREFVLTSSPSMDILISSNLERLIYTIAGQDAQKDAELMTQLKEKGVYEITAEMKEGLKDFVGGFATEEEVKETIHDTYQKTGYVMDTHTAVAAHVCAQYRKDTKDEKKCLVASTASPYKFVRNVMTAIDPKYDEMEDFALIDELEKVSGFPIPNAIKEIRDAEVRHTTECDADQMKETVKNILGV